MVSNHYKKKRSKRENLIDEYVNGDGYMIDGFIVDRGHKNGAEVHSITINGIIVIHNLHSGRLVTKLIARPHQIERYYEQTKRERPPEYKRVLKLAQWHQSLGYNRL